MSPEDALRAEARRLAAEYGPLKDLAAALPRILADAWNEGWVARDAAVDPTRRLRIELEHHATTRRLAELAQRYSALPADALHPDDPGRAASAAELYRRATGTTTAHQERS